VIDNVIVFLKNSIYDMSDSKGFEATVFNPTQHFWNGELFGKKYKCDSFKKCELGKQHVNDSGYKGIWENPCSSSGNTLIPRVIFVGEAPGNYNEYKHSLPFYGDRSGDIFHNALRILRMLPTEVYVTNVIHCSPKNHSLGKYSETKERLKLECVLNLPEEIGYSKIPIVALGRVADKTLNALRIKHKFIYHPSYYARIGKPEKFVDDLHKTFAECECII
jgi:uracil-DNA glycosylase family 4